MKINSQALSESINKELRPIYVLFAEESFQLSELSDEIINKAKNHDYNEKLSYVITKDSDWSFLDTDNENLDLFGSKKIIEVKLLGAGPGNKGSKALKAYSSNPDPMKLLIVLAEGLDKKSQSSAWSKALDDSGIMVIENPISQKSMPSWIKRKAENHNLSINEDAALLLSEKSEGNLLAAIHEITKLSLLYSGKAVGIKEMEKSITNSSKYGIFDLSNAFVKGERERIYTILESLKAEGTQPALILWAISKEIHNLYKVKEENSTKNIWGPKFYLDALSSRVKQTSKAKIKFSIQEIAEIDSSIKGLSSKNPWQSIRDLAINF
ncbi:MAG: DNA polymerase III subunit delta [Gammaproteobacteria bacterium]|nr:DNA polymerase III subunit delta [Gammaproteobacteria bacterium]HJL95824.1 DNA polymerase III subunit delta [SAR86 cluster bacterium]|tara:strand:+ start:15584 stop:16555 length:972 start_codon:yes stop_codon:yes gene_type:complete